MWGWYKEMVKEKVEFGFYPRKTSLQSLDPLVLTSEGCITILSGRGHQRIRQPKEKLIFQFFNKGLLSSRHSESMSAAGASLVGVCFLIPCSRCRGY